MRVLIANRLSVPDGAPALLWDMDGVLLDTLMVDFELVNRLLRAHAVPEVSRQIMGNFLNLARRWGGYNPQGKPVAPPDRWHSR